ncbi:outer membrane beta-barrel protein [Rhodohalobacter sp. 614A]|uniref:outer membrane beta-barrel protein n=1 Tax=Rhodohalobacter sp. 614A TaxID=2908649 RepID=UPI001F2F88B4|nr:outer membrane beta-barrel protein [Rhodohalobacter sp. 614A]
MNKFTYAIILSLGMFLLAAISAQAQTITAGGGVGYGSKSEDFNFQVNAYYSIPNLPLRIGGDVGFSKPEDNLTQIEGNANVHLMLLDKELISIYGLTGLNVLYSKISVGDVSDSSTDTGLNVGGGAEVDLGFGRAFGEAKYVLGSEREEQLVLGVGVRVAITN